MGSCDSTIRSSIAGEGKGREDRLEGDLGQDGQRRYRDNKQQLSRERTLGQLYCTRSSREEAAFVETSGDSIQILSLRASLHFGEESRENMGEGRTPLLRHPSDRL